WISPIYPSPMADFGYDVADYCNIDPLFGTLADFDVVLSEAHRRGLKVILDFVPNHTSDQHPWFAESRSARDSAKRDFYIWRDPAPDGGPPNNWISNFGGSAWEYDEPTGQYYYHAFLKEQPDLNWRNPAVRAAMYDVLRFWMRRGVDGFRVDAITNLVEDELLRDDPPNASYRTGMPDKEHLKRVFTADRPETHGCVAEMRAVLDEIGNRVLIGEAHLPIARIMEYYGGRRPGFHLPFNFILLHTPWSARSVEAAIDQYTILLPRGAWPNWVLGNHDEPRVASRIGEAQVRIAAMLLMTLRGTPFIYYGEEIGLPNTTIPDGQVHDPVAKSLGKSLGRDPQRSPMPWDGSPNGGFTEGDPWLPLGADHCTRNVSQMQSEAGSILNLYHRLIALRRNAPALATGSYEPAPNHGDLLGYRRCADEQSALVILNLGASQQSASVDKPGRILISTHMDREGACAPPTIDLRPNEGLVIELA
ncbi:alpha-amylase family glycosyl hydrolase, partial [Microvirga massiliensis]|uniref:alpha-amylase family glycosyl hydrolase n=1 Tax=Microvirga massiliensis TaxID=1033741 RepID=UPI00062BA99A